MIDLVRNQAEDVEPRALLAVIGHAVTGHTRLVCKVLELREDEALRHCGSYRLLPLNTLGLLQSHTPCALEALRLAGAPLLDLCDDPVALPLLRLDLFLTLLLQGP